MRPLFGMMMAVAMPCLAQDLSAPPAPPVQDEQPPPAEAQPMPADVPQPYRAPPSYAERCFSYPAFWISPVVQPVYVPVRRPDEDGRRPHGATSAGGGTSGHSGGGNFNLGGGGGGGGGDGKAFLILAVVVAAILPIIVYAVDEDAPPVAIQRYECPSLTLDAYGGADALGTAPNLTPTGMGRFTFGYNLVGGDFTFDSTPGVMMGLSTHFLLRPPPKHHIEGAVAIGYRRVEINGDVRDGVEVGLPHRYIFWRDGLRVLGLEIRPALSFGTRGVEASLEAAFIIPIIELLHLRVGGRGYSFGNSVIWGVNAGLTLGI